MAKLDDNGHEIVSDEKVAIPVRFRRVESLTEQVRRIMMEQASMVAASEGYETFEEADDFAIEDDYDPRSPHEMSIEQELEGYGGREDTQTRAEGSGSSDKSGEEGISRRGEETPRPDEKQNASAGGTGAANPKVTSKP